MSGANWKKVLEPDQLGDGRARSVPCGRRTLCMTRVGDQYGALDNRCPHQGGPLGEGTIEDGLLRCPWHGWDFDPLTGKPPGSFEDDGVETFPVEVRADGVYVAVPEITQERTVGDVLAETLVNWNVRAVFGMVGHSNLGMADAIRKQEEGDQMRYVAIRHEGAAAFAASAYGKLTGRPAACLSIAGPGATNLLTGLWDANVDRSPVIALTGQVDTQVLGPGAFQEVDLMAAFGGVAQWKQTVLPGSRHAELVNLACKHAILNRGVSHLVLPDEVPKSASKARAGGPEGRLPRRQIQAPGASLQAAEQLLRGSRRPVIIVGHGARFHMPPIVALAETLGAPILTTFKGKGLIPDEHPLAGGVLGRSGTPIASWLMNESDALLVFGASFSNHTGITPKRPTIQVDWDPLTLGKFHGVDVPVWGEIGQTADALAGRLEGVETEDQRSDVAARWALWREEKRRRAADDRGRGLNSASIFAALGDAAPHNAILPVDVGNNTYSFGRYFECKHQAVLMSGYLGSIGFALPAALGAWAATREEGPWHGRKVVSVSGDGGLGQYAMELTTAVRHEMDLTHVVLTNGELGKITKEQRSGQYDVWQTGLVNPDFAAFAHLCGAKGIRVEEPGDLRPALDEAIGHAGPALVEIISDAELV